MRNTRVNSKHLKFSRIQLLIGPLLSGILRSRQAKINHLYVTEEYAISLNLAKQRISLITLFDALVA